jgi:predicted branched-subunit amino acid permease
MRTFWRTSRAARPRDAALLRDVGLVCLADGIVAVSFGAASVAGGLPWWVPVALSLLVFAGASQIAAVGVVLAGGSPFAAVAAGAVLNTRLFPYGLAVADVVTADEATGTTTMIDAGAPGGTRRRAARGVAAGEAVKRWLIRVVGTHIITDESVAFALRRDGRSKRRAAFWTSGIALFVVWNVSVLLGVALGSALHDTSAFGLDSTFPAVMLALALPTLTTRPIRVAAGAGAVIAVALTPVLPAGLPLLAALGGLGTRWPGWGRLLRRPSRRPGGDRPHDGRPRGHGEPDEGVAGGAGDIADDDEMTVGGGR